MRYLCSSDFHCWVGKLKLTALLNSSASSRHEWIEIHCDRVLCFVKTKRSRGNTLLGSFSFDLIEIVFTLVKVNVYIFLMGST
jgi:hypothetical protein